jgi:hypothetical protein
MLRCIVLGFLLLVAPVSAYAEDTGWIKGSDWWFKSGELNRRHMLLTKIECKDSNLRGLGLDAAMVRVFYEPNVKGLRWWWVGATNLTVTKKEFEEKGYHLVSNESYVRAKTGVRIYCLLFHK